MTPAGIAAAVQQSYDWAAAMTARHSGGKVALPAFDAAKVLTTSLPFKFENGRITVDAGVQNAMLRLAKDGQAQLFANGSWFQIPQLPKTGYQLKAVDLKAPPPPASEQSFVLLAPGKGAAPGAVLTFTLTLGGGTDRVTWKLVGSDGPDDFALVEGSGIALDGGAGNDELANLGDGYSELDGGAGNDDLDGGAGIDWLDGGDGDDDVNGGAGNDRIEGGGGADKLYGGLGDDFLDGGDGVDLLDAGAGADDLYGGAGDDELIDGEGDDDVFEGEWDDENGDGVDDNTADDAPEADDADDAA
jgi:Ca2+-binding RTX toxin-like protein